jgi:hypothetical protein
LSEEHEIAKLREDVAGLKRDGLWIKGLLFVILAVVFSGVRLFDPVIFSHLP